MKIKKINEWSLSPADKSKTASADTDKVVNKGTPLREKNGRMEPDTITFHAKTYYPESQTVVEIIEEEI